MLVLLMCVACLVLADSGILVNGCFGCVETNGQCMLYMEREIPVTMHLCTL